MEGRHCFEHLTVEENLHTGAFTRGGDRSGIDADLEMVYGYFPRLRERKNSLAGYTSGGEQQMTAIGRALMSRPKVVLLDEPSMGLAPQLVEQIFEIVRKINEQEGVTILLAEQNTNVALRYAKYGYILRTCRVEGSADKLRIIRMKEFYLGIAGEGRRVGMQALSPPEATDGRRQPSDPPHPQTARARRHDRLLRRSRNPRSETRRPWPPCPIRSPMRRRKPDTSTVSLVSKPATTSRAALQASGDPEGEVLDLQKAKPPLGFGTDIGAHVFMSPGPIYEPMGFEKDPFRFGRSMYAAGLRAGALVHNCFAYHLTPAGFMVDTGARACGCAVFPGGVGNTELQVRAIADLKPTFYGGTPSFLKIILEKAAEMGEDASSLAKGLVGGEALPPSLRKELADLGCSVLQCYGTADLGLVAYESPALEGMILDEHVIVEIVRPGTGDPVPEGEVGEIVVTSFNPSWPLIRFGTGICPPCCRAQACGAPMAGSRDGWAAPTRRPRFGGCSSTRARLPTSSSGIRRSERRGWSSRAVSAPMR